MKIDGFLIPRDGQGRGGDECKQHGDLILMTFYPGKQLLTS